MDRDDEILDRFSTTNGEKLLSKEEKLLKEVQSKQEQFMRAQNKEYLEQLFSDNKNQPVRIQSVQVTNGNSFRDSFLQRQLDPLTRHTAALSLEKLLQDVEAVSKSFIKLNLVENLLVTINPVIKRNRYRKSDTIDLVPVFQIVPVKKFYAKTGTNIGNGEGDGYIQFQFKNLFGGSENLSFDAVTGTKTLSSYLVNYTMPLWSNLNYMFESLMSANTRKYDWIHSDIISKGIFQKVYTQFEGNVNHELIIENNWKQLNNLSSKSDDVFAQAGSNVKSSLTYNIIYDTRLNKMLPNAGKFLKFGIEYNHGLFGKFPFLKSNIESQIAMKLGNHSSLIVTNKAGLLRSLDNKPTYILDRFFSGGPNDVRSFEMNSLGPKQYNSSVGGDVFANGGVSLITDIPKYTESSFKFHNFVNYGKLINFDGKNTLKQLTSGYSVSYGFGILFNHPQARFELNVVLPLSVHERDGVRKGLQYGIGVSFL